MRFKSILFVRRTITQMRMNQNERGFIFVSLRALDCAFNCYKIIAIFNRLSMPSISIETLLNIFCKSEIGSCR